MGKIHQRVHRKDKFEDHAHKLPDGSETGGMLMKANIGPSKEAFGDPTLSVHSHLYQLNGNTCETEPSANSPDHEHMIFDDQMTGKPIKK